MPVRPYHVWINDDNEIELHEAEEYLQLRFPERVTVRKHRSYDEVYNTLIAGKYEKLMFRSKGQDDVSTSPISIPPPHLVIQDYVFGPNTKAGILACQRTLEDITRNFPTAKVVMSTSQENVDEVQRLLNRYLWNFPITSKVVWSGWQPIDGIISNDLDRLGSLASTADAYK